MNKASRIIGWAGLIIALSGQVASVHAQSPSRAVIMTIRMSAVAKVFDLSPTGSEAPPQWTAATFDDSAWDHAQIPSDLYGCPGQNYWPGGKPYWGANSSDHYLFRQTFSVPRAQNYYGSQLDFATPTNVLTLTMNGKSLITKPWQYGGWDRIAIFRYLHRGLNVIAGEVKPSWDKYNLKASTCNAISFAITLRAAGVN
jgi:hypothetical protein